ncbi:MAG: hypothetical protein ACK4VO_12375 [Pseudobdellovibrio sp.]
MSKASSKTAISKTQTADDILADLMNDLKEVDKTVIGFDASQVSEDVAEATQISAPDNLDLDLDADISSDSLLPGLSDLRPNEEHATLLTNVSVSLNPLDEDINLSEKPKSNSSKNDGFTLFGTGDDLGDLNLETFQGVLERTKIENAQNLSNSDLSVSQFHEQIADLPIEEKTSIFSGVDLTDTPPEDSKFSKVSGLQSENSVSQSGADGNFSDSDLASKLEINSDRTQIVPIDSNSMSIGLNSAMSVLNKKTQQLEKQASPVTHLPKSEPSLFGDDPVDLVSDLNQISQAIEAHAEIKSESFNSDFESDLKTQVISNQSNPFVSKSSNENSFEVEKTQDIAQRDNRNEELKQHSSDYSDNERTLAVAGFNQKRDVDTHDDKVKISVGQIRNNASPSGYASWGAVDSNLVQAENLKMAQEKILELERENEKVRQQNEDLISASEIVKERADLLNAQLLEFKNDREALEQSFKNELAILKKQLERKDGELHKAVAKADDLDSKIKFDLKKIRIRERELENRLELIRAEKNALMKSKDEQILDLKRKLDQVQLEVESYRQKCVDLNKIIETSQDSFKRTARALRLAMANLELQEENKAPLKKVE